MNVNLRGLIVGTQLVIPDMVAAGRGRIINVTSEAGGTSVASHPNDCRRRVSPFGTSDRRS
jgi:NADP-dependent 3-hydroxy acid dehydrogenase YdfG